jgi:chitinase
MSRTYIRIAILVFLLSACSAHLAKNKNKKNTTGNSFAVIAYYSGNSTGIDSFAVEKLTHIIFSFGHLKGNRLSIANARDTATIQKLVALKARNPQLKVILSLGGWGGCQFCSPVFATDEGRKEFALSAKELITYFKADGIDLDWEYPAIEGYPGHAYTPGDKQNFTALIKTLRHALGRHHEISFAAGGFDSFLEQSVEWDKIMPILDKVNLMSYDLVSGYSNLTGHHTPLYSNAKQKQSADNAVRYLASIGVPMNKLIIGAAFYAREWDSVAATANGLYQAGRFHNFIGYKQFSRYFSADSGYVFYRDTIASATYAYSALKGRYATFDDSISIKDKTTYALTKGLGGIMFWELTLDKQEGGLLDVIDKTVKEQR